MPLKAFGHEPDLRGGADADISKTPATMNGRLAITFAIGRMYCRGSETPSAAFHHRNRMNSESRAD
jgi:hypothetical protein